MRKNIIIAALGAALITREFQCFRICPWDVQACMWLGYFIALLFFCLFCEEQREKWLKYKARVKKVDRLMMRITRRRAG